MSADGGQAESLGTEYEPLAVWSRESYIYTIRKENGARQLGKLDRMSGRFQRIVDIPAEWVFRATALYSTRLSLASDGKSLATTIQKPSGDIWILDGFQATPTLLQRLLRR